MFDEANKVELSQHIIHKYDKLKIVISYAVSSNVGHHFLQIYFQIIIKN